ncbi:uncharacterized protein LOC106178270 [Lingula anatina]|uniref:Uncharacterized protein LOC106178270 n=1 Tax=Lingula anatina TaxID=7574 RepID=A0A1S3K3K6_LINAN|nr:uncharacterized protein LOC106178270 [Lingula anatina]|eukprot:XP_013416846.1 uncharacterized protein LOC106178270 [Lingula anatina]
MAGKEEAHKTSLCGPVLDHIYGTIYGNCIGDAIGLLTEFMCRRMAKQNYGKAKVLEYNLKVPDMHRSRWEEGDWTDDSDQMILIMQSLIEHNGVVKECDFASKMIFWMKNGFPELGDHGGMGIGATTHAVLSNRDFLTDPHKAAHHAWEKFNRRAAPNGGVMRTSILGIYQFDNMEKVIENTLKICKVTHADPRCLASCVAVTTAIAMMLQRQEKHFDAKKGKFKIDTIIQDSYTYAKEQLPPLSEDESVQQAHTELKEHMFAKDLKSLVLDEPDKIGYTYKCLGAGFWALQQKDFRKALSSLVMEGGDADTNGAVAGALLGCKLGAKELPESWRDKLKHKEWLDNIIKKFLELMEQRHDPALKETKDSSEPTQSV